MWVKAGGNNAINLDHIVRLIIEQDGGNWVVNAYDVDNVSVHHLNGTWATEAEAEAAVQRLVDYVDLTTYE